MVGDARTPATDTRVPDPTSNAGYATPATQAAATSPAGTPAPVTSTAGSTPAPVSSPVSQTNLRSNILDESPAPTPGTPVSARTDDGLGALPGGKASMEHVRRQIPPTPVIPKTDLPSSPMPVSASSPAPLPGTTTQVPDQVPPISGQPLPTIGSGSSLPPAPLPPAPLPAPETDTPKPSSAPSVPPYLK
jgi:hypothetical protein